jgi:hypothetical protein
MQEGKEAVVAVGAAAVICLAIRVQPAFGFELKRVRTPEGGGSVDGPGSENDGRAFGDELIGKGGVIRGDAHGESDGRPKS